MQAPASARLIHNGLPLLPSALLTRVGVPPLATLRLAQPLRGGMTIKVRTLTGREIEIDIEPTDTVERIKERLEEKEGIAPDQQRLIFSGANRSLDTRMSRPIVMLTIPACVGTIPAFVGASRPLVTQAQHNAVAPLQDEAIIIAPLGVDDNKSSQLFPTNSHGC